MDEDGDSQGSDAISLYDSDENRSYESENINASSANHNYKPVSASSSNTFSDKLPKYFDMEKGFRSVEEIPFKYRHVFAEYPCFNYLQSRTFDDVFGTDNPMVVTAPTGSGKTVIFELAIVRLLCSFEVEGRNADFKIVYMAPIKALCTEKLHEWARKFSTLQINCLEVTGDTDIPDLNYLRRHQLILTTPEKWDSLTRRWRDDMSLMETVRLFLIDEVHILNEENRGPTLEVVVSRMKVLKQQQQQQGNDKLLPSLRFIAVSATIPNIEDLVKWLGCSGSPAKSFKIEEEMRPVKLLKVVKGYDTNASGYQFDIHLSYKLRQIISEYSKGRPTLIFCSTRKSVFSTADILSKMKTFGLSAEGEVQQAQIYNQLVDNKVKDLFKMGIGCHHAGMILSDRGLMENAFRAGLLPVLIATSTLAMGVNLPAHLVIIKSTQYYGNGGYQDYSDSQILQMMGRAGRPQFDTSAVVVIMTKATCVAKYERLSSGTEPVQSSLHRHLAEHVNAEVVLGTVRDLPGALDWMRSTFLYVRAIRHPQQYGLSPDIANNPARIDAKLQEMVQVELNGLAKYKLVKTNGVDIQDTPAGRIMARYYIACNTMKIFVNEIQGTESLGEMLVLLSRAAEFDDVLLRRDEKATLNALNCSKGRGGAATGTGLRFPIKGKIQTRDSKVNCLLQAAMGGLHIHDPGLSQESGRVVRSAERVAKCLLEVVSLEKHYRALLSAVLLHKCIKCQLWENSMQEARQLPRIGAVLSQLLVAAGKTSLRAVADSNPRDLERILNRLPPFGNVLREAAAAVPRFSMSVSLTECGGGVQYDLEVDDRPPQARLLQIEVSLANPETAGASNNAQHWLVLIVGDSDNKLLLHSKVPCSKLMNEVGNWSVDCSHSQAETVRAHFISEMWVGIDVEQTVRLRSPPPPPAPTSNQSKPKRLSFMEQQMSAVKSHMNTTDGDGPSILVSGAGVGLTFTERLEKYRRAEPPKLAHGTERHNSAETDESDCWDEWTIDNPPASATVPRYQAGSTAAPAGLSFSQRLAQYRRDEIVKIVSEADHPTGSADFGSGEENDWDPDDPPPVPVLAHAPARQPALPAISQRPSDARRTGRDEQWDGAGAISGSADSEIYCWNEWHGDADPDDPPPPSPVPSSALASQDARQTVADRMAEFRHPSDASKARIQTCQIAGLTEGSADCWDVWYDDDAKSAGTTPVSVPPSTFNGAVSYVRSRGIQTQTPRVPSTPVKNMEFSMAASNQPTIRNYLILKPRFPQDSAQESRVTPPTSASSGSGFSSSSKVTLPASMTTGSDKDDDYSWLDWPQPTESAKNPPLPTNSNLYDFQRPGPGSNSKVTLPVSLTSEPDNDDDEDYSWLDMPKATESRGNPPISASSDEHNFQPPGLSSNYKAKLAMPVTPGADATEDEDYSWLDLPSAGVASSHRDPDVSAMPTDRAAPSFTTQKVQTACRDRLNSAGAGVHAEKDPFEIDSYGDVDCLCEDKNAESSHSRSTVGVMSRQCDDAEDDALVPDIFSSADLREDHARGNCSPLDVDKINFDLGFDELCNWSSSSSDMFLSQVISQSRNSPEVITSSSPGAPGIMNVDLLTHCINGETVSYATDSSVSPGERKEIAATTWQTSTSALDKGIDKCASGDDSDSKELQDELLMGNLSPLQPVREPETQRDNLSESTLSVACNNDKPESLTNSTKILHQDAVTHFEFPLAVEESAPSVKPHTCDQEMQVVRSVNEPQRSSECSTADQPQDDEPTGNREFAREVPAAPASSPNEQTIQESVVVDNSYCAVEDKIAPESSTLEEKKAKSSSEECRQETDTYISYSPLESGNSDDGTQKLSKKPETELNLDTENPKTVTDSTCVQNKAPSADGVFALNNAIPEEEQPRRSPVQYESNLLTVEESKCQFSLDHPRCAYSPNEPTVPSVEGAGKPLFQEQPNSSPAHHKSTFQSAEESEKQLIQDQPNSLPAQEEFTLPPAEESGKPLFQIQPNSSPAQQEFTLLPAEETGNPVFRDHRNSSPAQQEFTFPPAEESEKSLFRHQVKSAHVLHKPTLLPAEVSQKILYQDQPNSSPAQQELTLPPVEESGKSLFRHQVHSVPALHKSTLPSVKESGKPRFQDEPNSLPAEQEFASQPAEESGKPLFQIQPNRSHAQHEPTLPPSQELKHRFLTTSSGKGTYSSPLSASSCRSVAGFTAVTTTKEVDSSTKPEADTRERFTFLFGSQVPAVRSSENKPKINMDLSSKTGVEKFVLSLKKPGGETPQREEHQFHLLPPGPSPVSSVGRGRLLQSATCRRGVALESAPEPEEPKVEERKFDTSIIDRIYSEATPQSYHQACGGSTSRARAVTTVNTDKIRAEISRKNVDQPKSFERLLQEPLMRFPRPSLSQTFNRNSAFQRVSESATGSTPIGCQFAAGKPASVPSRDGPTKETTLKSDGPIQPVATNVPIRRQSGSAAGSAPATILPQKERVKAPLPSLNSQRPSVQPLQTPTWPPQVVARTARVMTPENPYVSPQERRHTPPHNPLGPLPPLSRWGMQGAPASRARVDDHAEDPDDRNRSAFKRPRMDPALERVLMSTQPHLALASYPEPAPPPRPGIGKENYPAQTVDRRLHDAPKTKTRGCVGLQRNGDSEREEDAYPISRSQRPEALPLAVPRRQTQARFTECGESGSRLYREQDMPGHIKPLSRTELARAFSDDSRYDLLVPSPPRPRRASPAWSHSTASSAEGLEEGSPHSDTLLLGASASPEAPHAYRRKPAYSPGCSSDRVSVSSSQRGERQRWDRSYERNPQNYESPLHIGESDVNELYLRRPATPYIHYREWGRESTTSARSRSSDRRNQRASDGDHQASFFWEPLSAHRVGETFSPFSVGRGPEDRARDRSDRSVFDQFSPPARTSSPPCALRRSPSADEEPPAYSTPARNDEGMVLSLAPTRRATPSMFASKWDAYVTGVGGDSAQDSLPDVVSQGACSSVRISPTNARTHHEDPHPGLRAYAHMFPDREEDDDIFSQPKQRNQTHFF